MKPRGHLILLVLLLLETSLETDCDHQFACLQMPVRTELCGHI